jgi:hypothetical protein
MTDLTESDVLHVLNSPRRRLAVEYLWDVDATVPLRELSEAVAAVESGETPAPRNVRESVYNALHQTHLPTLDDLGVVDYDESDRAVRVRATARTLVRRIRDAGPLGVPWAETYRGVGIAGLCSVVGSLAGAPLLASVDPLVPATAALGAYAVASAYQVWTLRSRAKRNEDETPAPADVPSWRPAGGDY